MNSAMCHVIMILSLLLFTASAVPDTIMQTLVALQVEIPSSAETADTCYDVLVGPNSIASHTFELRGVSHP